MADLIANTYEIIEKLGAGGGGNVYLANHLRLGKQVVLKADKRKITTRQELLRREVDVLKNLRHHNIPQVYDFFTEEETVYTAMEYIAGESLDRPLKRGETFSQAQVVGWAAQILDALCYLHSPTHGDPPRGYVHSDIKPANLMRRPDGSVCLIDFNISLALGEENLVGGSIGYASPEHYGLDFSFSGTVTQEEKTVLMDEVSKTVLMTDARPAPSSVSAPSRTSPSRTSPKRLVLPDARSDLYSTGATLYHLLSGQRPHKNAKDVIPLSKERFSPQIVDIIRKAMEPNPDLRYQSAEEMLEAFRSLHDRDPRTLRHRRHVRAAAAVLSLLFLSGVVCSFAGLKGMERAQAAEAEAARMAEEAEHTAKQALADVAASEDAYRNGDIPAAVQSALSALSAESPYAVQAQKALTDALGVYDLSEGFKPHLRIQLPSAPAKVVLSPGGTRAGAVVSGQVLVFDTDTGETLAALPAEDSALSSLVFISEDRILYSGDGALRAYDLSQAQELWSGAPAVSIALSGDKTTAAAAGRGENEAVVYDTATGNVRTTVSFGERSLPASDTGLFADTGGRIFMLDETGGLLAVSFPDGSLQIFDLRGSGGDIEIFDPTDFSQFTGGFYGQYFAFSAKSSEQAVFAVIDTGAMAQTGGFASPQVSYNTMTTENGIYVASENVLVNLHPVTGEQTEAAYTDMKITAYDTDGVYTAVVTEDQTLFIFDGAAVMVEQHKGSETRDFVKVAGDTIVLANRSTPSLQVLRLAAAAPVMTYDRGYAHNEARFSADGSTVMLFRYNSFRIYDTAGTLLADVEIPDAERVYDQQFRRDGTSRLEVIYADGLIRSYSAADGTLLSETMGEVPDGSLYDEYFTDNLRITAPLHGTPMAYSRETGELVGALEPEDYLTYVTQLGDNIITEYINTSGERYGLLLNEQCQVLAKLPQLCDILENGSLIFDDNKGNLRQSRVYSVQELTILAAK